MPTTRSIILLPALLASLLAFTAPIARSVDLYVATDGNDSWSGKLPQPNNARSDGPFASIDRARDEIRKLKASGGLPRRPMVVEIRGGLYELKAPIELSRADSGSTESPIEYRAHSHERVRLTGGRIVSGFTPVTDPGVLARLDPAARAHVLQADLHAQGIADLGDTSIKGPWAQSHPGLELFFRDRPMTIARWPNAGFARIADVLNIERFDVRGTFGDRVGKFVYEGDRPARWAAEKDIWLDGYWFWDWSEQRQRVDSIDTVKHVISLSKPYHGYGYRRGQWYYAFNILAELDEPGEWYLDRQSGKLYFWPPSPIEPGTAVVSVLPSILIMRNVSHVTFRGLTLEAARGLAVSATNASHVRIAGCTIRNVGASGVSMTGSDSGVVGCDLYQLGDGGISLSGGDRRTLRPANLYADNNHIHDFSRWNTTYTPGISLDGVGCSATHNLIHDAPHEGIFFSGNDHRIEYNEIHDVCTGSNDAGAIYAGRDWTMRGTVIRYNYLHHVNGLDHKGCVGVYLDDQFSGTLIYGNIFWKVTNASVIGGGRDVTVENNIFVDCAPAAHVDARGLGWAAFEIDVLKDRLNKTPYKGLVWSKRYPRLVNILEDDPMAPKGDAISHNIFVGGRWSDFEGKAKPLITLHDNLIDQDPRFVAPDMGDFRLKAGSPAFAIGFRPLPIKRIGLYRSPDRAAWPVRAVPQ